MERDEDMELTRLYEGSGLFAKIIDIPAEETFRCGFAIKGDAPGDVVENAVELLELLQWDDKATTSGPAECGAGATMYPWEIGIALFRVSKLVW